MSKPNKCRVVALLVGLAFLICSTAALSHIHSDSSSEDQSHCSFCLVAHIVAHVVWCPPVVPQIALVQTGLHVSVPPVFPSSQRLTPAQGRAPPVTA
jgi:hypothetical protein